MDFGDSELKYFISKKSTIVVVSMVGEINEKSEEIVKSCIEEALSDKPLHIVLNLQGISNIENKGIPNFIRFQKDLRDSVGSLYICFLRGDLLRFCLEKAALRENEVKKDLITTLKQIVQR